MTPEDHSGPERPLDDPHDLITEAEPTPPVTTIRELLGPRVLLKLIGHRRHFETDDGTGYWVRSECEDLLGAIRAGKVVRS